MTIRLAFVAVFFLMLCAVLIIAIHWQLYLPAKCRGDVPKIVPFHQGMTLCPGQSATF